GLVVDIQGRPSREIVDKSLAGLVNLTHRGAVGADARSGDGSGIMVQIPYALFADVVPGLDAREYGIAMLFLPREDEQLAEARSIADAAAATRGLEVVARRDVPIDPSLLGVTAKATLPAIVQLFLRRPDGMDDAGFERELMIYRRFFEQGMRVAGYSDDDFFAASCSSRTIIYKAFCLPEDLARFYPDLGDPRMTSAIALFHQRFSTNTEPTWGLAQPFRFIAHNGEINTVQGNRAWMRARRDDLMMDDGDGALVLDPPVAMQGSDSLSLDTAIELLRHNGRSLPHALMMAIPQ